MFVKNMYYFKPFFSQEPDGSLNGAVFASAWCLIWIYPVQIKHTLPCGNDFALYIWRPSIQVVASPMLLFIGSFNFVKKFVLPFATYFPPIQWMNPQIQIGQEYRIIRHFQFKHYGFRFTFFYITR